MERVLGFTADEVMALPSVEPLLSDASMADANQTLAEELQARDNGGLSSYQERTVESEVVRRDGTTAWVESKFAVLDGADGKPAQLLGVTRDISDKRTLQASVAQADRLANMGMLASGVAHEINNPLSYVLYNLESVLEDWPTGESDDLQDQLREALDGTKRITQIARALGTFSRVEPIHVEEIDLQAPLEHALRMAHNELKYRAKVTRDFKSIPAVFASEGRLAQVFLNLLINAAHAIGEGDVSRHEVKVSTWAQGDRVFAAVSDTGGGIAPEHAERIFEPFFSTKGIGTGSGLGLAICRNIVEGFGGTISFESQLGKGTRFVIALPHRVPDVAATPATDEPPASVPERIRILVVDDERPIRRILTRMLGRDHTVVLASSGEEACSILEEDSNFQVILCDLMMPHMSGTDLHQTLRQSAPELAGRIVFMTGGAFTPTTQAYLARFDNRRVDKPFRAEDVRRAVNNVAVGRTTASSAPPE